MAPGTNSCVHAYVHLTYIHAFCWAGSLARFASILQDGLSRRQARSEHPFTCLGRRAACRGLRREEGPDEKGPGEVPVCARSHPFPKFPPPVLVPFCSTSPYAISFFCPPLPFLLKPSCKQAPISLFLIWNSHTGIRPSLPFHAAMSDFPIQKVGWPHRHARRPQGKVLQGGVRHSTLSTTHSTINTQH